MLHFINLILTILAVVFLGYFGIIKGESMGFGIGLIFFVTGTIPWVMSTIKENKDKK